MYMGSYTEYACPHIEEDPHRKANSTKALVDTHLLLTCDDGFRFASNVTQKIIRCEMDSLTWNDTEHTCQGLQRSYM